MTEEDRVLELLSIDDSTRPVGFIDVCLLPNFPNTGLVITAVSPEARGKGIATKLARDAIDYFTGSMTVSRLRWIADSDNDVSQKLASSLGLKKASETAEEVEFVYTFESFVEESIEDTLGDVKSIISSLSSREQNDIGLIQNM